MIKKLILSLIFVLVLISIPPRDIIALAAPAQERPASIEYHLPKYATIQVDTIFFSNSGVVPIKRNISVRVMGCYYGISGYLWVEFMGIQGVVPAFATSAYYAYQRVCLPQI